MRKIGPKDSKPELFIRKLIHSLGYRYRLHRKDLPGKPDLVFPKFKKVIFVNGCFWHGHRGCKKSGIPKTNIPFWEEKFKRNADNDKKNCEKLNSLGWEYLVIWQCEIKQNNINPLTQKIIKFLI